jgi:hypothetical protein
MVESRDIGSDDEIVAGPLVLAERPRHTSFDFQAKIDVLEAERRLRQLERRELDRGGVDIIRESEIVDSNGDREEVIEIKKDRRGKLLTFGIRLVRTFADKFPLM